MSQLASLGIDFGSQRSVIAAALRGGVKILDNEGSHRETQNVIGFTAEERFIGEQGALQQKSNFKNTVGFFNRFLGLHGEPPFRVEETKWLTVPTSINDQGKTLFDVTYHGQKVSFTPEQLTASMLNKLKQVIAHNDINVQSSNVCISVQQSHLYFKKLKSSKCIVFSQFINKFTNHLLNYSCLQKS